MLRIDEGPARLRAAVAAVGQLPAELRKELRAVTKDKAVPAMRAAAGRRAAATGDPRAARLAQRATYSPYRDVPGVRFGGSRPIDGTGTPARVVARALEYGSPGDRRVRLRVHSPKGTPYGVVRHTTRNWRPDRGPAGAFVTPAALDVGADVLELWIDTVEQLSVRAWGG